MMGVTSLQSFLKANDSFVSDRIILNNTCLVIDGNNLVCQLYISHTLNKSSPYYGNHIYGGDFVNYSNVVKEFFANLQKCNITPILVFDGSVIGKPSQKDVVASKEKEVYQRALKKFKCAQNFVETSAGDDILLPQTINTIFRNIINDLKIKRVQAVYEADTHVARLANENCCPVLTNDSDFIIYQLKEGFILLDWFEYEKPIKDRSGKHGILCSLFSQRKLCKSIPGLRPECLSLVSVILGNDYVEAGTFDQVVERLCNHSYEGFLNARSYNHRRIANLLIWLRQKSLDDALEYIINQVHPSRQQKLRGLLRMLMKNYNIEQVDDFDSELDSVYAQGDKSNEVGEFHPREYLKKQMEIDDLGQVALDMIFHNTHYNYTIVDDWRLPSSGYVKLRPYSLALVLLRPKAYTNLSTNQRKILSEQDSISMYDRHQGEYKKLIIRPMDKLNNFGTLEHLDCQTMILLDPALKRDILMSCFHFSSGEHDIINDTTALIFQDKWIKEVTICMILVKYIGIETGLQPKPQFVDALLVTFFFRAACCGGLNQINVPDASSYGPLLLKLRTHSMMVNNNKYEPYDNDLFRRILHFISQLQQAYKSYSIINSLLGHPFHLAYQGSFMNCTLIYRLTKLFRLEQEKLDTLFKDIPRFLDLCGTMRMLVNC